jgi:hypothetical protein
MVLYGITSSEIQSGEIKNIVCPHCKEGANMHYSIYGKYCHIYYIPFFPVGKEKILECNHCKASYYLKDLPQQIQEKFAKEQVNNPVKTPIKHFSLTFVLIAFFILTYFMIRKENADTIIFAKNPQQGDVFYEKTSTGKFSTSKITKVTNDSVFVMQNNKESERRDDVDEQSADSVNYTMPFAFSKKYYEKLALKGDSIYKIVR